MQCEWLNDNYKTGATLNDLTLHIRLRHPDHLYRSAHLAHSAPPITELSRPWTCTFLLYCHPDKVDMSSPVRSWGNVNWHSRLGKVWMLIRWLWVFSLVPIMVRCARRNVNTTVRPQSISQDEGKSNPTSSWSRGWGFANLHWSHDARQVGIIGSNWFKTGEIDDLVAMMDAGLIDFSFLQHKSFGLDQANEAIKFVGDRAGGLSTSWSSLGSREIWWR